MKPKIEYVDFHELNPYTMNPRKISPAAFAALKLSLQEFGFVDHVLARREDKVLIGGHQRVAAWRELFDAGLVKEAEIPVRFMELSDSRAKALNLALNKISGEWEMEILSKLLSEPDEEFEKLLQATGFSEEEIGLLKKDTEVEKDFKVDEDEVLRGGPGRQSLMFYFDDDKDYALVQSVFQAPGGKETSMDTMLLIEVLKEPKVAGRLMELRREYEAGN